MRYFQPLSTAVLVASIVLSGCTSLTKPSDEKLSSLPVVELGATPPSSEFVLKIPGGKPIPIKVTVDGSALVTSVEQILNVSVPHDVYVYKTWASDDGRQWKRADTMFGAQANITLPSTEATKGGDIHLTVDRKNIQ